MSEIQNNYGLLINRDIKLQRTYFKQMTALLGINCIYRAPRPSKEFDAHGELATKYYEPQLVPVIFQDHPDQKTLKKMGWVAELGESSSIIHVPYDLQHLAVGALFTVPPGLDNAEGRVFRVISMQNIMVYPASIACEIAPEYGDKEEASGVKDFTQSNFNLLRDNEEDDQL